MGLLTLEVILIFELIFIFEVVLIFKVLSILRFVLIFEIIVIVQEGWKGQKIHECFVFAIFTVKKNTADMTMQMAHSTSGISHILCFIFLRKIRAYRVLGCPVGSNFEPFEKFPNPNVSLDVSQKYLSDCLKSFGSKTLREKTRAYRAVRFFTAR